MQFPLRILKAPETNPCHGDLLNVKMAWNECYRLLSTTYKEERRTAEERLHRLEDLCDAHPYFLTSKSNGGGQTLIHVAAFFGNTENLQVVLPAIALFVQRGACVDPVTGEFTPLQVAAANGHTRVCQVLLEHGARISAGATDGLMPLFLATAQGHADTTELLVRAGSSVHEVGGDHLSIMHYAVHAGHSHMLRLLHELGASHTVVSGDGRLPIHDAARGNGSCCVRALLEIGANPRATVRNDAETTPLHEAALCGNAEACCVFLEHESYRDAVDARDNYGRTPLMVSSTVECTRLLLDHGAELSATCEMDHTALHYAAESAHPAVMRYVMSLGLTDFAKDREPTFPLHAMISRMHRNMLRPDCIDDIKDTCRLLHTLAFDLNALGFSGQTPLLLASRGLADYRTLSRRSDAAILCEWLLQLGADPNLASEESGSSPLIIACSFVNREATRAVRALILHGAALTELWKVRPVPTLLEETTALHEAVYAEATDTVRLLLESGADPNLDAMQRLPGSETSTSVTPLVLAVFKNVPENVIHLLRHGARVPEEIPVGLERGTGYCLDLVSKWRAGTHPEQKARATTHDILYHKLVPDLAFFVCQFLLLRRS